MDPGVLGVMIPLSAVILSLCIAMFALYFRYRRHQMYHRERMAAIEKNMQLPEGFFEEPPTPTRTFLLRGLIWLVVGVGMAIFFVALAISEGDRELFAMATLGLIPVGVGTAYLIVYKRESTKIEEQPS
jgi:fatty acid desaturase